MIILEVSCCWIVQVTFIAIAVVQYNDIDSISKDFDNLFIEQVEEFGECF